MQHGPAMGQTIYKIQTDDGNPLCFLIDYRPILEE